jgi:hypothetical protein
MGTALLFTFLLFRTTRKVSTQLVNYYQIQQNIFVYYHFDEPLELRSAFYKLPLQK